MIISYGIHSLAYSSPSKETIEDNIIILKWSLIDVTTYKCKWYCKEKKLTAITNRYPNAESLKINNLIVDDIGDAIYANKEKAIFETLKNNKIRMVRNYLNGCESLDDPLIHDLIILDKIIKMI